MRSRRRRLHRSEPPPSKTGKGLPRRVFIRPDFQFAGQILTYKVGAITNPNAAGGAEFADIDSPNTDLDPGQWRVWNDNAAVPITSVELSESQITISVAEIPAINVLEVMYLGNDPKLNVGAGALVGAFYSFQAA